MSGVLPVRRPKSRTEECSKRGVVAANDSRENEETFYLGSYEREIHSTKTNQLASPVLVKTVHRHSLGGFAIYTRTEKPGLPETVKLATLLKDHLGSTDVILTCTWNGSSFASDVQTERQSFDPWGERRDPSSFVNNRQADTDAYRTSAQDYDRGYTGHEQLDDSGLIHMNGRIYDPELGRMLSPDPYVQVPEYSQNFNRYSYVLNNPLNATDPSGYSVNWLNPISVHKAAYHRARENWRQVVVIVVVAVLSIFTAGIGTMLLGATLAGTMAFGSVTYGMIAAGAFIGAVSGGLSAALAGGDLGDVLRGAVVGGISGAMTAGMHAVGGTDALNGANIVGHGVIGGASNVAMGGKFGDGFLSAAASAATSVSGLTNPDSAIGKSLGFAGRTAVASTVGGTVCAIGGGKFANGAVTGAFHHVVNAEGGFWQRAVNGAFGRNGEGFKLELGERAALSTFGSDPWHSNPELREYITQLAAKNNIDVELLRAVIYNETGTRLGGATTEAWISSHSDYGTYGPAQLGPEARSFADLSIADSLTMRGGLKGAAAWLGFQKGLLEVNIINPTNAQIASRYNQGRIFPGTVNRYGARIQWIINKQLPVHDAHPLNNR